MDWHRGLGFGVDREKFDARTLTGSAIIRNAKSSSIIPDDHHPELPRLRLITEPTITPVETAHHSAIPGHLSLIAMLVRRKIKWNPVTEQILGDPEASKLLSRRIADPGRL